MPADSRPWLVSARLAWRDLRAAPVRLYLSIAAIALGVAAFTAVRNATAGMDAALQSHTRDLLGADLTVRLFEPPSAADLAAVRALPAAAETTVVTEANAMALSETSAQPHIVTVKAVDPAAFPLYGALTFNPQSPLADALDSHAALVDAALLPILATRADGVINIAGQLFRIAGVIRSDPTRLSPLAPIPEVIVSRDALDRTGLGIDSPALHHILLRLSPGASLPRLRAALEHLFPSGKILDLREPDPGVSSALASTRTLLTAGALAALALGVLGVAAAVTAHLRHRIDSIAVLKCLGARNSRILSIYVLQTLMLAVPGSLLGALLGIVLSSSLAHWLHTYVPAIPLAGLHPRALAEGLAAGILSTLAATFFPLLRIRHTQPLPLLRRGMVQSSSSHVALLKLRALRRLRRLPLPATARHAIAGAWRPGANSAAALLMLTLGATVLLTFSFIAQSVLAELAANEAYGAENLYVMNIPADQVPSATAFLNARLPEPAALKPYLALRLTTVNGRPIANLESQRYRQSWFATSLPNLPTATAALSPRAAAMLAVHTGDTLTFEAQEQTLNLRIHRVEPLSPIGLLHPDLIVSPDALETLRIFYGAALRCPPSTIVRTERAFLARFPNTAVMDMAEAVAATRTILDHVLAMVRLLALSILISGLVILTASVAGSAAQRQREAAIFRVLGASTRRVFALYSLEFAFLGLIAGTASSLLSSLLATQTVRMFFPEATPVLDPRTVLVGIFLLAALSAAASWTACFRPVFQKPLDTLRQL